MPGDLDFKCVTKMQCKFWLGQAANKLAVLWESCEHLNGVQSSL